MHEMEILNDEMQEIQLAKPYYSTRNTGNERTARDGNTKVLGKMRTVPSLQNRNYQAINTRSQADIGGRALI